MGTWQGDQALSHLEKPYPLEPEDYPWHEYYELISISWQASLHWVYKLKLNQNHKIPGNQVFARSRKPLGVYLCSMLNLCQEIHTWCPSGYVNAWDWFSCIGDELKKLEISGETRTEENLRYRSEVKSLKNGDNPYFMTSRPHMYRLIQAFFNIDSSGKAPNIKTRSWITPKKAKDFEKGVVRAFEDLARHQERSLKKEGKGVLFVEDGLLMARLGSGNDCAVVPPLLRGALFRGAARNYTQKGF